MWLLDRASRGRRVAVENRSHSSGALVNHGPLADAEISPAVDRLQRSGLDEVAGNRQTAAQAVARRRRGGDAGSRSEPIGTLAIGGSSREPRAMKYGIDRRRRGEPRDRRCECATSRRAAYAVCAR